MARADIGLWQWLIDRPYWQDPRELRRASEYLILGAD